MFIIYLNLINKCKIKLLINSYDGPETFLIYKIIQDTLKEDSAENDNQLLDSEKYAIFIKMRSDIQYELNLQT